MQRADGKLPTLTKLKFFFKTPTMKGLNEMVRYRKLLVMVLVSTPADLGFLRLQY